MPKRRTDQNSIDCIREYENYPLVDSLDAKSEPELLEVVRTHFNWFAHMRFGSFDALEVNPSAVSHSSVELATADTHLWPSHALAFWTALVALVLAAPALLAFVVAALCLLALDMPPHASRSRPPLTA